ncbi:MAG TPA: N-6 DNA methylase [Gemmatimonadaceae bacterium]|nr:N-6 DNA methylase [Gemmatimonadaceae bacterium]
MRTLRDAAALLTAADSADTLLPLAIALGFEPVALPLDEHTRASLGIPDEVIDARIVRGTGALRALLIVACAATSLRALLARIAGTLESRTGSVLWLLVACTEAGEVGLACWPPGTRPPRLAALLARRERIVASDAEALRSLAAVGGGDDLLVHLRWCELLGREALSRRFYRTLEQRVSALAESLPRMPDDDRSELGLLAASRLLFLSFLEAKGWLDGDRGFLASRFDACMARGGAFHQRVLLPLWFGTLNTPLHRRARAARAFGAVPFLNGGLFAKTPLERRHGHARLSDESLGAFFAEVLGAYRFTAREEQAHWSEASIDPEMLGRAFESLMVARERRVSGAFYTPQPLVAHVADAALAARFREIGLPERTITAALAGEPLDPDGASALRRELSTLAVLDPACGSGAFLVYLLERIAAMLVLTGDPREIAEVRRTVLARSIHGVDINPTAVWLCELRLWLSVVIESAETRMSAVPPLPNLDCNVRVGDALAGDAFDEPPPLVGPPAALARLRDRYVRASGVRKAPLRRALEREERRRALAVVDRQIAALRADRRERLIAGRSRDLFGERVGRRSADRLESRELRNRALALRRERQRLADGGALPFGFASHFGHVHARGGFQLVVANPPWVRLHNIPAASRAGLRARFRVFREAAWTAGSRSAGAGPGFGAQIDLAALFAERSVSLAAPSGVVALLVPAKLWRSLSGGGVRALLSSTTRIAQLEDWSDAPCAFDAAVYPSVVIAARGLPSGAELRAGVRRRTLAVEWSAAADSVRLHRDDDASPWLLMPPEVRRAFDALAHQGRPLSESALGRPTLGVKCGCNDAFTVELLSCEPASACVEHRGRRGVVERELLRPLLRGESVTPWQAHASPSTIVWTHGAEGPPLERLPSHAARWLAPWRSRLSARADLRGSRAWWSLFRTEGADPCTARVVWSDFGRIPRAAILPAGDPTVPLNSCYVLPCPDPIDALALTALLNSALAAAWLNAVAEPARGGWHRYLAWTVSLLPIPHDWARARHELAPLAERALLGSIPTTSELLSAACRAYRVKQAEIDPLLAWAHDA